jgi:hypothetical protein
MERRQGFVTLVVPVEGQELQGVKLKVSETLAMDAAAVTTTAATTTTAAAGFNTGYTARWPARPGANGRVWTSKTRRPFSNDVPRRVSIRWNKANAPESTGCHNLHGG